MKLKRKNKKFSSFQFNRLHLVIFLVAMASVGSIYLYLSRAAAPNPPSVYLSSSATALPINTTFTVQVRENSGANTINAVQADFTYPASLVDFVSIDTSGTSFTTDAQSTGGNGQVAIARGIIGTLTGDQLVATVTFKTKTTGGNVPMAFLSSTALVDSTTNRDLLGSLSNTAGRTFVVDTNGPTVSISSPAGGSVLNAGDIIAVTASASDAESSVAKVEIYIDGVLKSSPITAPYTYSWNTSGLSLGSHTIQAKATDAVGNITSSAMSTVTLADKTPPTVSLTSPTSGTTQSGTVTIMASATDNPGGLGVAKVEIYIDGQVTATLTSSPYTFSWNTKTVSNSTHSLFARAYDNASPTNVATSTSISVNVDNTDRQPPTVPGNFRSTGSTASSIDLAWTASTDNVGVVGYRIQRNGTTIASTPNLTFTDSDLTIATSYTYTIVAFDAAGNPSQSATLTASTVSIPGDVNGDGHVTIVDLAILLSYFKQVYAPADFNKDGIVNIVDLSILLSNYGR